MSEPRWKSTMARLMIYEEGKWRPMTFKELEGSTLPTNGKMLVKYDENNKPLWKPLKEMVVHEQD